MRVQLHGTIRSLKPAISVERGAGLDLSFPNGIDQATIVPMRKQNPGYVTACVVIDDDNISAVPGPAANLVDAVDI
jgi:hypothetical protein